MELPVTHQAVQDMRLDKMPDVDTMVRMLKSVDEKKFNEFVDLISDIGMIADNIAENLDDHTLGYESYTRIGSWAAYIMEAVETVHGDFAEDESLVSDGEGESA
ncbi:MAG: hypothetical protein MPK62_01020 [Alphaproteobacteria bacterium]|nr:hypothetical protein [Alphaproteobacteria bacterium]